MQHETVFGGLSKS